MSGPLIEFADSITAKRVEYAYGLAQRRQMERNLSFGQIGMRAAKARDPKLLKALEKATEIITKQSEDQFGRTRRDPGTEFRFTIEPTEVQLWREAYTFADKGEPLVQFEWIYGAAAWLCGYNY